MNFLREGFRNLSSDRQNGLIDSKFVDQAGSRNYTSWVV